jgi:hypothetical protein
LEPHETARVEEAIETEARTTSDMHLIFSKIGVRLGMISDQIVRHALLTGYCEVQPREAKQVSLVVEAALAA